MARIPKRLRRKAPIVKKAPQKQDQKGQSQQQQQIVNVYTTARRAPRRPRVQTQVIPQPQSQTFYISRPEVPLIAKEPVKEEKKEIPQNITHTVSGNLASIEHQAQPQIENKQPPTLKIESVGEEKGRSPYEYMSDYAVKKYAKEIGLRGAYSQEAKDLGLQKWLQLSIEQQKQQNK